MAVAVSDVIFALPRTHYDSYQDLYRVIALSGYPTCFIDEIDAQSDNTYIVTILNGEIGVGWPDARARIIVMDLEWRTEPNAPIPGVAEFWTGDRWHSTLCNARYVPLGSHPDLKPAVYASAEPHYDAAFLGYVIPRREAVLNRLRQLGVHLPPTSAWGEARHRVLSASRAYLHIHQLDHALGVPPLRMIVAAAYSLPVISETVTDRGIFTEGFMMTADHGYLADLTRMWACGEAEQPRLRDYGQALHQLLCHDLTFRRSIERAL
jgi:hypothetical protein